MKDTTSVQGERRQSGQVKYDQKAVSDCVCKQAGFYNLHYCDVVATCNYTHE